MGRRSSSGVFGLLGDIVDDVKGFVDEDVLDRGRDAERDVRRTGRNAFDGRDEDRRAGGRSGRETRTGFGDRGRDQDLVELREAITVLRRAIDQLGEPAQSDLPISGYDELTAVEVNARLASLSQAELRVVDDYERAHASRSTVTGRIESLRGTEPWSGYDEQTVVEIRKALTEADAEKTREVHVYEAGHKNRQGVLDATGTAASS